MHFFQYHSQVIILFLLFSLSSLAQDTLILSDKNQVYEISLAQSKCFQDHTQKLGIQEVAWAEKQHLFKSEQLTSLEENSTTQVYWFQFTIGGDALKDNFWYLEAANPHEMQLSYYAQREDGAYQMLSLEKHKASIHQYFQDQGYAVEIPQAQSELKLLCRVKTQHPESIAMQLKTVRAFHQQQNQAHLVLGFFYGILFFFGAYHLLLFFWQKRKIYLAYFFMALSTILWASNIDDLAFRYLWYNFSDRQALIASGFSYLFLLSLILFASTSLKLHRRQTKYFELVLLLSCLSLLYY